MDRPNKRQRSKFENDVIMIKKTEEETKTSTRKHMYNRVLNGITSSSMPAKVTFIKPCVWTVLGTTTRTVRQCFDEDKTYFVCDCQGKKLIKHCRHVVAVMTRMMIDQAEIAGAEEHEKQELEFAIAMFAKVKIGKNIDDMDDE
jgi:hypothetical protein